MLLFIVTGLSGAGKTSLVNELFRSYQSEFNLRKIVSYTTRAPRKDEVFGQDYFFVTDKEFERLVETDFFLETSCYENAFYGTPKFENVYSSADDNLLIIVDIKGTVALKTLYPEIAKAIFITAPSLQEAAKRLKERGSESTETIELRSKHNVKDLEYFSKHKDLFSLIFTNDEFSRSVTTLATFVRQAIFESKK